MEKKRLFTTLGAMVLTGAIAVTGTWAFLNKVTETKTNTFTSSKDISTELVEENFDEEIAENYIPGQVIAKDPVMKNDAEKNEGLPIYVGVKLEYIDNNGKHISREEFIENYAEIMNNGEEGFNNLWKEFGTYNDGSEFYVFKNVVQPGASSDPIFTDIKVITGIKEVIKTEYSSKTLYRIDKDENGNDKEPEIIDKTDSTNSSRVLYEKIEDKYVPIEGDAYTLPKFEIKVTGYAVQGNDEVSQEEAIDELVKLAEATSIKR